MDGKDIKGLRRDFGLSQERFARLLGVALQTVRRWEVGISRPLPIISIRLGELQRELKDAQRGAGGVSMSDGRKKSGEGIEVGLGGLFKGLGSLFEVAAKMAEEGKDEYQRSGETDILGGKGKAMYGFSVKMGLGGKPIIEQFGNIKPTDHGPVVTEIREPLVDVLDEGDRLVVVAELPGVGQEDIHIEVRGDILELVAEAKDRKYSKEVLLPAPVVTSSMESSYRNGVLEIRFVKKK